MVVKNNNRENQFHGDLTDIIADLQFYFLYARKTTMKILLYALMLILYNWVQKMPIPLELLKIIQDFIKKHKRRPLKEIPLLIEERKKKILLILSRNFIR